MPARDAAMDALYARFVRPGDLAFDIGTHVGDRIGSFRRLGARVVALEPQPLCARAIRAIYAGDDGRDADRGGLRRRARHATLRINSANPTVSTASADFVVGGRRRRRLGGQVWDTTIEVPCTTLDALIAEHGAPAFAKIDVEGFEDTVLAGLSRPLPALSFEFTTIQRDVALALPRSASLARALRLRRGARREPGAHLQPLDLQGRHGRPHRRPAARGQLRGCLLCSAELTCERRAQ